MPVPRIELGFKYLTAPEVRKKLGLSRFQFDLRIERGILPEPVHVDENGIRYFDENWLRIAEAILQNAPNLKKKRGLSA